MKPIHLRWIGAGLLLAAIILFAATMRKTITLSIDGSPRSLTTYAFTVGQVLTLEHIAIGPGDRLDPPPAHWLGRAETITLDRAAQVLIWADGQPTNLLSAERLPSALLVEAGIALGPEDVLLYNGFPISSETVLPRAAAHTLQIRRAVTLSLIEGDRVETISAAAANLGQALWGAGINLFAADRIWPALDSPLTEGIEVTLLRSRPVTITSNTNIISFRTAASTVGEAIVEAGLALQGLDFSLPAAEALIPADGQIRLVRVSEAVLIEETPLPFETVQQPLPEAELDTQQIVQPGVYGISARRVRVRYEDGLEISRQTESEWVAIQPQPRILGYGTNVVMHTVETADGVINYWRVLQFWATSYAPKFAGGDTTASGQKVRQGLVGVDRNYVPFGTQMYVPGYGYAEAADTGGIIGRWIDLGYSDDDYVAWHQWVTVYFLWPPPAYIPYVIPPPSTLTGYTPPGP